MVRSLTLPLPSPYPPLTLPLPSPYPPLPPSALYGRYTVDAGADDEPVYLDVHTNMKRELALQEIMDTERTYINNVLKVSPLFLFLSVYFLFLSFFLSF